MLRTAASFTLLRIPGEPMKDINLNLVTTAFEIPDHRIVKNVGVVRGIVVRSRSVVGSIGASLQTLLGGNITL